MNEVKITKIFPGIEVIDLFLNEPKFKDQAGAVYLVTMGIAIEAGMGGLLVAGPGKRYPTAYLFFGSISEKGYTPIGLGDIRVRMNERKEFRCTNFDSVKIGFDLPNSLVTGSEILTSSINKNARFALRTIDNDIINQLDSQLRQINAREYQLDIRNYHEVRPKENDPFEKARKLHRAARSWSVKK